MRRPAARFPIVLALGAIILAPRASAQAQDSRQEGPTEIEKCQTIDKPGSYKLVKNLTFTVPPNGGSCLLITADFVTIDLAGFSISFSGPMGFSSGISVMPPSGGTLVGITVRNGSISSVSPGQISAGVDLGGAIGSIVEGLHVSSTGLTGIAAAGIVKGNTVTGVTHPNAVGISATGLVTGNYVSGNRNGMTIGAFRLGGSTVIGNTVTDNAGFGIRVDCPSNVTDNTAVNNGFGNLVLNGEGCNNTNNVAP
jgi:hypothetical protein